IHRERIINGDTVPDEYVCPVCRCRLWNPCLCASCQHLFCQKCIRIWHEYSKNNQQWPLYEERRCPPSFQSLLSHVKIKCRNTLLGCSEVLSYDSLEQYEKFECEYLTQTCSECMQPM
ncbi:unnamed protein product, partial [Rotaria magnacalcarata]